MNVKSVLIVFLGNIHFDTRVNNLYRTFHEKGYKTRVISFDWLTSGFISEKGDISVFKLGKKSSLVFYLRFAYILSRELLFTKADIIFAEDIYTLPFSVIFGKLKGAKIFYDSREVYGHLAGLVNKKKVQILLSRVEKIFIKYVYKVITTGELDSAYIKSEYPKHNPVTIRNLPYIPVITGPFDFRQYYKLDNKIKILLYQGVILHGRGLRLIFDVIGGIENCIIVIIGGGEYEGHYRNLAIEKKIEDRVYFFGKISQNELLNYTAGADIGLSVIENLSLSYYYALPNKMFEYIITGVPVLASNFPQLKTIIDKYNVGLYIDPEKIDDFKNTLQRMVNDDDLRKKLSENCFEAGKELNWEKEIKKLLMIIENK